MSLRNAVLAWGALLALGLAGCDSNPAAPQWSLDVQPHQMQLYVGENAPVLAQLLHGSQRATPDEIVFWSQNTAVAAVNSGGVVTAVLPGSTRVMVRFGDTTDSVTVTVLSDTRGQLQTLDIVPGEVSTATESGTLAVPYVALDGYGRPQCTPAGLSLRFDPFIVRTGIRATGTRCDLMVTANAEGETWLVASVQGLTDSVKVRVQNGAFHAFYIDATPLEVTAGNATQISVRVLDPAGKPAAGQTVWFFASPGLLDRASALTDTTGTATATWTPPRVLAASGGTGQIVYRTLFPTGSVGQESRSVPIRGGAAAGIAWFSGYDGRSPLATHAVTAPLRSYVTFSAAGRDGWGNQTSTAPTLTYAVLSGTEPGKHEDRGATCAQNLEDPQGLQGYAACYASYRFLADAQAVVRVYASYAGGVRDSLDVTFQ